MSRAGLIRSKVMSERHEVFTVEELCIITHTCQSCGNLITFDIRTDETHGFPKRCSVCSTSLGVAAIAIQAYRDFYRHAMSPGAKIRLQTISKRLD